MVDQFRLVLLRHGEAERFSTRDEDRALTGCGRDEVTATARDMEAAGVRLDRIASSPLLRARQTAGEVAAVLAPAGGSVEELAGMTPDDDPYTALKNLESFVKPGTTVLVATHMPLVAALVGVLAHDDPQAFAGLSTGAAVLLSGEQLMPGACRIEGRFGR